MKTDTTNTDLIRSYLLDAVTDDERSAVEERFFTNDAVFDEMLAVEDELFYEYKQDELSAGERAVFEKKFLRTREDRDRVVFAGAFLDASANLSRERNFAVSVEERKPSLLQSIIAFFNFGSALQFGMAAAGFLLAIGVIGLLIQNSRINNELASSRQQNEFDRRDRETQLAEKQKQQQDIENQLAAEREKGTTSEDRIKELEAAKTRLENEVNERRRAMDRTPDTSQPGGQRTIATLIISPGLFTRSDGVPMNRIELSPATRSLNLNLRLKNVDEYPAYSIKITDIDIGIDVLSRSNLKASGKGTKKSLGLAVPAKSLRRGDYEVTLSGITKTGEIEEITKYYFSVVK